MKKQGLITSIAAKTNMSPKDTKVIIEALFEELGNYMALEDSIQMACICVIPPGIHVPNANL